VTNSITISMLSLSVKIAVDPTEFRTEHLHNTNVQRYCYIKLVSDLWDTWYTPLMALRKIGSVLV
jgi:hypothetical protein